MAADFVPRIFIPGKIVQVRDAQDPLLLSKLVLISVEEHVRHVVEMLEWLFPGATAEQRAGARLHDVRKKVGARYDFFRDCGFKRTPTATELRADFYGNGDSRLTLSPTAAAQGFLRFAQDPKRRRLWPVRGDGGIVTDVRLDLDPPFGNHAAEATEDDLVPYRDGAFTLAGTPGRCDHVLSLVRLHHSFQPDRIVSACAQHGEQLAQDLYRLIVADHAGSRWAEYVVQLLEGGAEQPERTDFFGDVEVKVAREAEARAPDKDMQVGLVRLRRSKSPAETENPHEVELLVRYHSVTGSGWDLRRLVEGASAAPGALAQRRRSGARRVGRARS
jgi:hypothetical protein